MRSALIILALAALLAAQVEEALKDALARRATAGPGAIQQEFLDVLRASLEKRAGKERAKKMLDRLKTRSISALDVRKLMNGGATTSQVQEWFGAGGRSLPKVEAAVADAVDAKERSGYFGILLHIMVRDFGIDPTADFCAQVIGAKDELSRDEFRKLCRGNVSTGTVKKAFGLTARDDCKFMQDILLALQNSPLVRHPMLESLGLGRDGTYDRKEFPPLQDGMRGHGMEGDAAGGLACDLSLPPCPHLPGTFAGVLKACRADLAQAEAERRKKREGDAPKRDE